LLYNGSGFGAHFPTDYSPGEACRTELQTVFKLSHSGKIFLLSRPNGSSGCTPFSTMPWLVIFELLKKNESRELLNSWVNPVRLTKIFSLIYSRLNF